MSKFILTSSSLINKENFEYAKIQKLKTLQFKSINYNNYCKIDNLNINFVKDLINVKRIPNSLDYLFEEAYSDIDFLYESNQDIGIFEINGNSFSKITIQSEDEKENDSDNECLEQKIIGKNLENKIELNKVRMNHNKNKKIRKIQNKNKNSFILKDSIMNCDDEIMFISLEKWKNTSLNNSFNYSKIISEFQFDILKNHDIANLKKSFFSENNKCIYKSDHNYDFSILVKDYFKKMKNDQNNFSRSIKGVDYDFLNLEYIKNDKMITNKEENKSIIKDNIKIKDKSNNIIDNSDSNNIITSKIKEKTKNKKSKSISKIKQIKEHNETNSNTNFNSNMFHLVSKQDFIKLKVKTSKNSQNINKVISNHSDKNGISQNPVSNELLLNNNIKKYLNNRNCYSRNVKNEDSLFYKNTCYRKMIKSSMMNLDKKNVKFVKNNQTFINNNFMITNRLSSVCLINENGLDKDKYNIRSKCFTSHNNLKFTNKAEISLDCMYYYKKHLNNYKEKGINNNKVYIEKKLNKNQINAINNSMKLIDLSNTKCVNEILNNYSKIKLINGATSRLEITDCIFLNKSENSENIKSFKPTEAVLDTNKIHINEKLAIFKNANSRSKLNYNQNYNNRITYNTPISSKLKGEYVKLTKENIFHVKNINKPSNYNNSKKKENFTVNSREVSKSKYETKIKSSRVELKINNNAKVLIPKSKPIVLNIGTLKGNVDRCNLNGEKNDSSNKNQIINFNKKITNLFKYTLPKK